MDVPATYNDGRTAQSRPVTLRIEAGALVILDSEGAAVDRWPAADVHLVDRPGRGQPVRLRCGFDRDDRLTLADDKDLDGLDRHCPGLGRTTPGWSRYWRPVLVWGAAAAVSMVLVVTVVIPRLAQEFAYAIPAAMQQRIGEQTAEQVIRLLAAINRNEDDTNQVCAGQEGQAALDALAARLAGGLDAPVALRVRVVDTGIVNAFTLPGGHILVLRGLLDFAGNGDEVAAVLAHEIGHVARHHPIKLAIEMTGTSLLIGLLIGDVGGGTVIAGLGQLLLAAAYTQEAEREADAIATELMNAAGYDAAHLGAFLERVEAREGEPSETLSFFSTHPPSADRANTIRGNARRGAPALTDAEWTAIRAICA